MHWETVYDRLYNYFNITPNLKCSILDVLPESRNKSSE